MVINVFVWLNILSDNNKILTDINKAIEIEKNGSKI